MIIQVLNLTQRVAVILLLFGLYSCSKKESYTPALEETPITLSCDYFSKNPNALLQDNPNAPVDYIVPCRMSIHDNVTLEPGVTIAFETGAGFFIGSNGSLNANGTSVKKITLTGTDKKPGAWAGIYVNSNDVKNEISNAIIEYAGGATFNSNGDKGAVIIHASGKIKLSNNLIQYSAAYGVNNYRNGDIENFENNRINNNNIPGIFSVSKIDQIKESNNFEGNTTNKFEIAVAGTISSVSTWYRLNIPYMVTSYSHIKHSDIDAALTIQPGTIIEMGEGTGMKVTTKGSLKIVGTPSEKIIIRGVNPIAGSWRRIEYQFTSSPNNQIQYAEIMHAGANPTDSKGGVYMWANPMLSISNTHFSHILSCAVYAAPNTSSPNPNLSIGDAVTYSNCGGEVCGD